MADYAIGPRPNSAADGTIASSGSMAPRLSTISKRPFFAWAMYMFMRTWCWPGTISAGPADVVLAGNHFRRTARPLGDPSVIERRDDVLLAQRAGLVHGRRPELHPSVEAGAGAAARKLLLAGIALVVRAQQRLAEGIADVLVVVEAAVEAFHMRRRQQAE